jgi:hypothetical protein
MSWPKLNHPPRGARTYHIALGAPWSNRVCDLCKTDTYREDFSKKQQTKGVQSRCRICCGDHSLSKVRRPVLTPQQIEKQREKEARDRLAWEVECEKGRQEQRARMMIYERQELARQEEMARRREEMERKREEQRALDKVLVQPMLRANGSMMAASSFWGSTNMITHALAFLPAGDVLACSVATSRHLADTLKETAGLTAVWAGLMDRGFPDGRRWPSALKMQQYKKLFESVEKCARCRKSTFPARLTVCAICPEQVCLSCERCVCKCDTCLEPCLEDDLYDEDEPPRIGGDRCPGCEELACQQCAIDGYRTCGSCNRKYCRSCTGKNDWRVCADPTVTTLITLLILLAINPTNTTDPIDPASLNEPNRRLNPISSCESHSFTQ